MVAGEVNLNASSSFRSSPKYSFSSCPNLADKKKDMPGPGQYGMGLSCDKDKFRKEAAWTLGGGTKDAGKAMWAPPGPGTYTVGKKDDMPKWIFSGESRLKEIKRSSTPGPGQYEVRSKTAGFDVSFSGKPEGNSRTGGPGPGQYKPSYDSCTSFRSSPKISFGGSCRAESAASKTPGPGHYPLATSLCGNVLTTIPPKYSIKGKYQQLKGGSQTPGPYSSATTFT